MFILARMGCREFGENGIIFASCIKEIVHFKQTASNGELRKENKNEH